MLCLEALALSMATISVLKTTVTLASPVDKGLQQVDVSADGSSHQFDTDRIPGSGTQEHWRTTARDAHVADLYVISSYL